MTLDLIELKILAELEDTRLWKQRIADQFNKITPQTVSRRIETLKEHGHVDATIIEPDGISRELIIAYQATDKGLDALYQHQICVECDHVYGPDDHTCTLKPVATHLDDVNGDAQ